MRTGEDPLDHELIRLGQVCADSSAAAVRALRDRLAAGQLRVLLVGEAKRGKSSLGNALLGRELLPSGVTPVTAISTTITRGSPERAEVRHHDGQMLTVPAADLERYVTEWGNPENRRGVDSVTVFLPDGIAISGLTLVDTPGVGSILEHNTAEARSTLETMDAAIMVLTSDPPISASERVLLQQITELSVTTFIVVNKVDRLAETELAEVGDFVRTAVTKAVGVELPMFYCSARDGLRARLDADQEGWAASGVAALADALAAHLAAHRVRDLQISIAQAARRLAAQELDQCAVTLATLTAHLDHRDHQVGLFAEQLDAVGVQRDAALDVTASEFARQLSQLDTDAAVQARMITADVNAEFERFCGALPNEDPKDLEAAGREVIAARIRADVEEWRDSWETRLRQSITALAERHQDSLAKALAGLQQAAEELLGVRLQAQLGTVELPDLGQFRYEFDPGMGWNQPLAAALRWHAPGRLARRQIINHLREELPRLVDKHVGRARADFQSRLQAAGRELDASITGAFAHQQQALGQALSSARSLYDRTHADQQGARQTLGAKRDKLQSLLARFEELGRYPTEQQSRQMIRSLA